MVTLGPRVFRLLLHPADPARAVPPHERLVAALRAIGLAGEPLACGEDTRYRAGPAFLDLVTFLGCSPSVELEPPPGIPVGEALDRFCHVVIPPATDAVVFTRSVDARPPRCPACRADLGDWQPWASGWARGGEPAPWRCPACGRASRPWELDWRQSAGFGRLFVELWGIHPGEAVPGDALMDALRSATGGAWRHFYTRG
jgi:hypothetical protein